MYQKIGTVSNRTVCQLLDILIDAKWEVHNSEDTSHQASVCVKQLESVDEIVARWPIDTWYQMMFMRLGPGCKLYRHHDEGWGFHIPIETNKDAVSLSYENGISKDQRLEVGEIYCVDRSIEHESINYGKTNRTHLIVILKNYREAL